MPAHPIQIDIRKLFFKILIALAICTVLVIICYYFIDRPVAFYVYNHQINKIELFKWLTLPPPVVQTWSPAVLALLVIWRAWRPWPRWQHTLFIACLSLIVADEFRTSLGSLCDRDWPETWHDNNPSLIGNDTDSFHPFHFGEDVGSFPSGHAARILGFLSVFWIALPRARALYALIAAPMLISLVAMDYHYVGDVVAGSFLGSIVGAYATLFGGISTQLTRLHENEHA